MDLDPSLFRRESAERLEDQIVRAADMVIRTDDRLALRDLFTILGGWAEHLRAGMLSAGFDESEAGLQSWQVVWNRLKTLLDTETHTTAELAVYIERSIGVLTPPSDMTEAGEPLDPLTRTFYRTFVGQIEHPAVHPTALWLSETD